MVKKQTKIVATISDLKCEADHIRALYEAGVNVVRLNTAHQKEDDTLKVIRSVRAVSDKIALLLDTKGPEVRTAEIGDPIDITEGDKIYIFKDKSKAPGVGFQTNYEHFVHHVPVGARVLIDDGETSMKVVDKKGDDYLVVEVENAGKIKNRKSVNVPGVALPLPSITEKDRNYIKFAAENDLDFVAHSFVRSKQDVLDVQSILDQYGSKAKIIAKIENMEGVKNIDEILDVAYGVMVARGDLGIEVPAEEVPVYQKMMIRKCIERGKPVITATQMLHTMIENPRPTRAEVSDVANAIFDGTDAIMLSGETAYGKYPLEAVQTMSRIAMQIEKVKEKIRTHGAYATDNPIRDYLSQAAINAIQNLPIVAVVCDTLSGRSARIISTYRADVPVYAKAHDPRVARQLALSYGVYPEYLPLPANHNELVVQSLESLLAEGSVKKADLVVILAGSPGHPEGSNFLEINTVELSLKGRKEGYC
ncbi:MAG: pyruvate kinase [Spirochaetales bacterium]|nr:pyruvate kinase [Spirochaetales bacterium]